MSLDAKFRPLATRMLRNLSGRQITFVAVTPGVYDPSTSTAVPTEVASTVYAYRASPDQVRLSVDLVEGAEAVFYVAAEQLAARPATRDRIVDGAQTMAVLKASAITSGLEDALYVIQVGKG